MKDRIFLTYVLVDLLFVACGGVLLIFALVTKAEITQVPTLDNVAHDLLLDTCPLNGGCSSIGYQDVLTSE